jgi:hypothetical protein
LPLVRVKVILELNYIRQRDFDLSVETLPGIAGLDPLFSITAKSKRKHGGQIVA